MENKRGLTDFQSSYGYADDEGDVSDDEEWQSSRPSAGNCSRQLTISLLPPCKKPRMDSSSIPDKLGSETSLLPGWNSRHKRIIIHVDIDCFYAQVEMIRNPDLRNVPLGIQQKHIVVTCNYVARKRGVTKLSFVTDAKKKCPDLVLVKGEDLTVYREFSGKVHSLLTRKFTPLVERLGMDENFLDVTELVTSRLQNNTNEIKGFSGAVYIKNSDESEMKVAIPCHCGCHQRLLMGSMIAAEIRQAILEEVGLTCCAGVANNKLLAKLVGGWKKPNMQTTMLPEDAESFMFTLKAKDIPGIGHSATKKLRAINVTSVADLLSCPRQVLEKEFGNLQSTLMIKLCSGIDDSPVTPSGEFKSITDEDSFKRCSTLEDARKRLSNLVEGLLLRVSSDCGVPETVKVTVRRQAEKSHKRESRQCRLPNMCFDNQIKARETLLMTCLQLFNKLVDVKRPFHLTLLGVSLSNFQKSPSAKSKNISDFFQLSVSDKNESVISSPSKNTSSEVVELYHSNESKNKTYLFERSDQILEHVPKKTQATAVVEESKPFVCPKGIDTAVFVELPLDVQKELETQWQQSARIQVKKAVPVTSKAKKCSGIQKYFVNEQK
ncbi:DNA polymerase iota-like [Montipora foliosa]|uniref:DNA polymerase iota-like n=1 Tax=Montipora foliosa TaxID=591990 RepID=UPI0035F15171